MAFGAFALGRRFRLYSFATILTILVFGALVGIEAPGIATAEPTPWIGLTERTNIGAFLLWVAVLATSLLRVQQGTATKLSRSGGRVPTAATLPDDPGLLDRRDRHPLERLRRG